MPLIVQKFGGTSVADVNCLQNVATKIIQTREKGHDVVVVVSAMSGETDRLINLAKAIHENPDSREYATLVATGEQVSIALLSMALMARGCTARSYTGAQAGIFTDNDHEKARILSIEAEKLRQDLNEGRVPVIAGFQGICAEGDITTLGRGGSDTTAVAIAAALKADECHIYTDVDGVYTADPKIVPNARRLDQVAFEEILELASTGAKVLQQRAVEFAGKYAVPVRVLSSFNESPGTLITFGHGGMEQPLLTGIALSPREAMISIQGLIPNTQAIPEMLTLLSQQQVDIDMMTHYVDSGQKSNIRFTLLRDDYAKVSSHLSTLAKDVVVHTGLSKVSLVGIGLRSHPDIISLLFKTLNQINITPQLISASEIKVSIVVDEKDAGVSMRALHAAFGLG
jgi:aspartate kinase